MESVNLKVIAVWASTLPLLPQSTRSALLSRFLPGGKQRRGGRRQAAESSLTKHVAKAPTVLMLIIDQMIKADEEIFSSFKVRAVIVHLRLVERESCQKINTFNHARELFCQSR